MIILTIKWKEYETGTQQRNGDYAKIERKREWGKKKGWKDRKRLFYCIVNVLLFNPRRELIVEGWRNKTYLFCIVHRCFNYSLSESKKKEKLLQTFSEKNRTNEMFFFFLFSPNLWHSDTHEYTHLSPLFVD